MGYEEEQATEISIDHSTTPANSAKRLRQSCTGDDSDWAYLLKSPEYRCVSNYLSDILHLNTDRLNQNPPLKSNEIRINQKSVLFANIRIIHFTLHLLYEELKLNVLRKEDLSYLSDFLSKISYDIGLDYYQIHYWKEFPEACDISKYTNRIKLSQAQLKSVICWPCMDSNKPVGIFQFLYDLLCDSANYPFPYIRNVNPRSKAVIQVNIRVFLSERLYEFKFIALEYLHEVYTRFQR